MENKNTRRGETQNNHLTNCHSRGLLSGIYNASRCKNAVMLNSFQHLHLTQTCDKKEEILNQVQDDNMIQTTRGFTLIELLVVVLIIGILAAVAVPQYQKAVMKSRVAEIKVILKTLAEHAKLYKLERGEDINCAISNYDNSGMGRSICVNKVDIEIPACKVLGVYKAYESFCNYIIATNPSYETNICTITYYPDGYSWTNVDSSNYPPKFVPMFSEAGFYCKGSEINCRKVGFNGEKLGQYYKES